MVLRYNIMSDVWKVTFNEDRQWTINTYKDDWNIEKVERGILYDYYREIQAFKDILVLNFDNEQTFEKKCYLDVNYLCTISHNDNDKITKTQYPGHKGYKLVVTWPRDGRKESWTLTFMVKKSDEFREFPKGKKEVYSFIYDDKMVIRENTQEVGNGISSIQYPQSYISTLLRQMEVLNTNI